MKLLLLLATLFALPCTASAQLPPGVLFRDGFESGGAQWNWNALWHLAAESDPCMAHAAPFPSPGHCAWWGHDSTCNFFDPHLYSGKLQLASALQLPSGPGSVVLRYERLLVSENCAGFYDYSSVIVSTNDGASWNLALTDCAKVPGWLRRRVDLSQWSGSTVRVAFEFDSNDGEFNDGLGWLVDDVEILHEPGTNFCKAGPQSCPCSHQSNGTSSSNPTMEDFGGCKHSGAREAELYAQGEASVANDTVQLVAADLPANGMALYLQGTEATGVLFGDGRLCLVAPFVRLAAHPSGNGTDVYPMPGEPSLSVLGTIPAGGATVSYQVVYRDAAAYCTASTYGTTNGYRIVWSP